MWLAFFQFHATPLHIKNNQQKVFASTLYVPLGNLLDLKSVIRLLDSPGQSEINILVRSENIFKSYPCKCNTVRRIGFSLVWVEWASMFCLASVWVCRVKHPSCICVLPYVTCNPTPRALWISSEKNTASVNTAASCRHHPLRHETPGSGQSHRSNVKTITHQFWQSRLSMLVWIHEFQLTGS